jgi:hypothetical protein
MRHGVSLPPGAGLWAELEAANAFLGAAKAEACSATLGERRVWSAGPGGRETPTGASGIVPTLTSAQCGGDAGIGAQKVGVLEMRWKFLV